MPVTEYILPLTCGGRHKNTWLLVKKKLVIYPWLKACSDFHLHFEWLHVSLRPLHTLLLRGQLLSTM